MDLKVREEELQALASENAVDWKEKIASLPDDHRLRIAALATLLRIDPMEALRNDIPGKKLLSKSRKLAAGGEKMGQQEQELLRSHGLSKEQEGDA